jgi:hypothetical protein
VAGYNATSVYWANLGTLANNYTDGTIMKVALDGGEPVTLASGQTSPTAIALGQGPAAVVVQAGVEGGHDLYMARPLEP